MTEREWLKKSLDLLGDSLPLPAEELLKQQEQDSSLYDIAVEEGITYCLFSVPLEEKELLILLAYSRRGNVIADFSAWHVSADPAVNSHALYDALSEESDWMYLEHYLYHEMVHRDLPYPPADAVKKLPQEEVLFTRSAYVSRRYRGRHIFTQMLEMMAGFAVRNASGITRLTTMISLDPDVACYGEDARKTPYVYSYDKDEPVRQNNMKILEHLGFGIVRVEYHDQRDHEGDGTKIWFALRKQQIDIVETESFS